MDFLKTYLWHVLLALDCVGTALVGGWPGETMSSYAYRMDQSNKPWGKFFRPKIDWLFSWQNCEGGHCRCAWEGMLKRLNMPPELR